MTNLLGVKKGPSKFLQAPNVWLHVQWACGQHAWENDPKMMVFWVKTNVFLTFSQRVLTTCSPHVYSSIWGLEELIWSLFIPDGLIVRTVLVGEAKKNIFPYPVDEISNIDNNLLHTRRKWPHRWEIATNMPLKSYHLLLPQILFGRYYWKV